MEFTSADRTKGWAVVIHLSRSEPATYVFKPKGLDRQRKYSVTFDNTGRSTQFEASNLIHDGVPIFLENDRASELPATGFFGSEGFSHGSIFQTKRFQPTYLSGASRWRLAARRMI
jgi:hypothetical protein